MDILDPIVTTGIVAAGASISIDKPAASNPGHYVLIAMSNGSNTSNATVTGFNLLGTQTVGTNYKMFAWDKALDVGDPSSWTVNFDSTVYGSGVLLYYEGAAGVLTHAFSNEGGVNDTTFPAPSVDTTGTDGCRIICGFGNNAGAGSAFTLPAGQTHRAVVAPTGTPRRTLVSDFAQTTGGVTGDMIGTAAGASIHTTVTVALEPIVDTGTTHRILPNAVFLTNLTGTVADVDDDPDSPDSNRLIAISPY